MILEFDRRGNEVSRPAAPFPHILTNHRHQNKATFLAVMAVHILAAFAASAFTARPCRRLRKARRTQRQVRGRGPGQDRHGLRWYKKTNDARIEAVKSGASTEALDAKLAKDRRPHRQPGRNEIQAGKDGNQSWRVLVRDGWLAAKKAKGKAAEYRHAFLDWMRAPLTMSASKDCAAAKQAGIKRTAMAAKPAPRKPSHRPVPLAASRCRNHRAPDCPPVGGHFAYPPDFHRSHRGQS